MFTSISRLTQGRRWHCLRVFQDSPREEGDIGYEYFKTHPGKKMTLFTSISRLTQGRRHWLRVFQDSPREEDDIVYKYFKTHPGKKETLVTSVSRLTQGRRRHWLRVFQDSPREEDDLDNSEILHQHIPLWLGRQPSDALTNAQLDGGHKL